MNWGAFKLDAQYLDPSKAAQRAAEIDPMDWVPTHPDGPYAGDSWRVIKLIDEGKATTLMSKYAWVSEIANSMQCQIVSMVFYSVLPGGELHKHRDISATLELGRLRFHIPLKSNSKVNFHVGGIDYWMRVGELWALNTSYIHAVSNHGSEDRIHLVIEVEVNPWVWSMLPPKNLAYYVHMLCFYGIVAWTALKTCLLEPGRFQSRFHLARWMAKRFLKKIRGDYVPSTLLD